MTDKTPAMPELPEPELGYIETDKSRQPAFSARQMREALQSQPAAAVSDEEIWGLWDSQERTGLVGGPCPVKFARAILALRPQAVPMTPEQIEQGYRSTPIVHNADPLVWFEAGVRYAEEHHHHHIRPNAEAK